MIAVAIGPDSQRAESQRVLTQTAGANVFFVDNFQSLAEAIDDIFNFICGMYFISVCISALNVPVAYLQ